MDFFYGLSDETLDRLLPKLRKAAHADYVNKIASEELKYNITKYEREVDRTSDALENLNRRKCQVLSDEMARFVDCFKKIKNIDYRETKDLSDYKIVGFDLKDYEAINAQVVDMRELVKTSVKSYLLGGILLGGLIMRKKADIIMNTALTHQHEVKIECQKIESRIIELKAIKKLAKQEDRTVRMLVNLIKNPLADFAVITDKKIEWTDFTKEEKQLTASLMSTIKLLKELIDKPVITHDGDIDNAVSELLMKEEYNSFQ